MRNEAAAPAKALEAGPSLRIGMTTKLCRGRGRQWVSKRLMVDAPMAWYIFPARDDYEKFGGVGGGGVLRFGSGLGGDCDTGGD
jgi:hypothetical protein